MTGRFKRIEGLDYKRGAIEYPHKLEPPDHYHLFTKPFYNLANKISRWAGDGLDEDTQRHFCDFANIAYTLALPAGARILDVGCGSGWLCEYFARLGYDMTGIDISPELISIAEERVHRLPFGIDPQNDLRCRFIVHDIESDHLSETFDAVVCYDALHHFGDEDAVLNNIAAMLNYGCVLFIAEGEAPPESSASGSELREVMKQFQTLESPFNRNYLIELLKRQGFALVGDYISVTGLIDQDCVDGNRIGLSETPSFNYLLAKKIDRNVVADSRTPARLEAQLSVISNFPRTLEANGSLELTIAVENTGNTIWLVSKAPLKGRVRIGVKILNEFGEVVFEEHGSPRLQRAMIPGEKLELDLRTNAPSTPGNYELKIDLLDQDICWFEQHGSLPLVLPFAVRAG